MCLAAIAVFFYIFISILKMAKKDVKSFEIVIGVAYCITLLLFCIGISNHSKQYYTAIDPVDECYTPFASEHFPTLIIYFLLFNISAFIIWSKGIKLPPLTLILCLAFLIIGLSVIVGVIYHVSEHNTESISKYDGQDEVYLFLPAPVLSFIIGIWLIINVINQKYEEATQIIYSNKLLNKINKFLLQKQRQPFAVLLLMLPIFLITTIILILFGQDTHAIVKVFTDTTTWRLSQKSHPPILGHNGHYLCTVAACGNPKVVKPLRFGTRGSVKIIVNRQLLIANAFESLLEDSIPALHQFIRSNYDKYGYNLSKKISTRKLSNFTYFLMKPLEWSFLICLYLFCIHPEERIKRQYPSNTNGLI